MYKEIYQRQILTSPFIGDKPPISMLNNSVDLKEKTQYKIQIKNSLSKHSFMARIFFLPFSVQNPPFLRQYYPKKKPKKKRFSKKKLVCNRSRELLLLPVLCLFLETSKVT
jgi:hypothetical protein